MSKAGNSEPTMRNLVWLVALLVLAIGGLGAVLLTEFGQILNLPRSWVFNYYDKRIALSLLLVVATGLLWFWHRRHRTVHDWVARGYVLAIVACLFFINLFAPYVWLRAQQHDAQFISVAAADKLLEEDADILVLEIKGDARAYPRDWIMVPHIAGDNVGGEEVAMTYCALSNLPQAFTTEPAGEQADYRVVAQVNNNLIFADTNTGEVYQQITGRGEFEGSKPQQYPVQRMPWRSFRALYPEGKVFQPRASLLDKMTVALFNMSLPGHYDGDPMFPTLDLQDNRLPTGEAVWGMEVNGETMAVPRSLFGDEDRQIRETLGGREVLIAWFAEYETLGVFFIDQQGQSLAVTEVDPYGNSDAGQLQRVHLYPGVLWMVWSHWYPDTRVIKS